MRAIPDGLFALPRDLHYICNMKKEGFSWKKRARSFRYAFAGIRSLIATEHNAWIHCAAAACAIAAGIGFSVSATEWIAIVMCIGGVLAAEGFNSAIEALADRVSPGYDEAVKRTKDIAAGAVLLTAIAAAVTGLIIFVPKIAGLIE